MDHQAIKDLLPLAALDRLEADEARDLDHHLRAGCDECEVELRAFRDVAASLPLATEPTGSEQRIWNHLETRLHPVTPAPAGPAATRVHRTPRRVPRMAVWQAATGAMAAAAIGITVYAGLLTRQMHRAGARNIEQLAALGSQVRSLRSELASANGQVKTLEGVLADRVRLEQVLMAPDLRVTRLESLEPAPGARAIVAVSTANHSAIIQAFGLPTTPPGKTYELWWITREGGPVGAGLFQVGGDRSVVAPASPPPPSQNVLLSAVTLEPAGGVSKPTGAMYLKGAPDYE